MDDEVVRDQSAAQDRWAAAARSRQWEQQYGGARSQLASRASSGLLAVVVWLLLSVVLVVASIYAWATDNLRPLSLFLPMAALFCLAGLLFWLRYRKDAAALREFDLRHPRA